MRCDRQSLERTLEMMQGLGLKGLCTFASEDLKESEVMDATSRRIGSHPFTCNFLC